MISSKSLFNINQLMVVVGRAIENSKLRRENSQLKLKEHPLAKFLGSSTLYRALKSQVDKVSKSKRPRASIGGFGHW